MFSWRKWCEFYLKKIMCRFYSRFTWRKLYSPLWIAPKDTGMSFLMYIYYIVVVASNHDNASCNKTAKADNSYYILMQVVCFCSFITTRVVVVWCYNDDMSHLCWLGVYYVEKSGINTADSNFCFTIYISTTLLHIVVVVSNHDNSSCNKTAKADNLH